MKDGHDVRGVKYSQKFSITFCTERTSATTSAGDECQIFADLVGTKMRKYSEKTKISVQRYISDILFKADEGFYDSPSPWVYNIGDINAQPSFSQPTYAPRTRVTVGSQTLSSSLSATSKMYTPNPSNHTLSELSSPPTENFSPY